MRQVRLTREAEDALASQIDYLIDRGAVRPAQSLKTRVETFLLGTLTDYPRSGRLLERRIWETWIPRTKLVVWYTFDDVELVVITFWHTSQDRQQG